MAQDHAADRIDPATSPLRYLALGDSYSIGEGVSAAGSWPQQLAIAARADGIALADPHIIATTGWTTDELLAAIEAENPQGPFALVSLLIGVNNQYRGRSLAEYREQFEQLLRRAIHFAGGNPQRVLVLSIPDWGVTPFAVAQGRDTAVIAAELDAFNAAAHACCDQHQVAFVDITPISRTCGGDTDMLVDDGLHPSAAMYSHWAQLATARLRTLPVTDAIRVAP